MDEYSNADALRDAVVTADHDAGQTSKENAVIAVSDGATSLAEYRELSSEVRTDIANVAWAVRNAIAGAQAASDEVGRALLDRQVWPEGRKDRAEQILKDAESKLDTAVRAADAMVEVTEARLRSDAMPRLTTAADRAEGLAQLSFALEGATDPRSVLNQIARADSRLTAALLGNFEALAVRYGVDAEDRRSWESIAVGAAVTSSDPARRASARGLKVTAELRRAVNQTRAVAAGRLAMRRPGGRQS